MHRSKIIVYIFLLNLFLFTANSSNIIVLPFKGNNHSQTNEITESIILGLKSSGIKIVTNDILAKVSKINSENYSQVLTDKELINKLRSMGVDAIISGELFQLDVAEHINKYTVPEEIKTIVRYEYKTTSDDFPPSSSGDWEYYNSERSSFFGEITTKTQWRRPIYEYRTELIEKTNISAEGNVRLSYSVLLTNGNILIGPTQITKNNTIKSREYALNDLRTQAVNEIINNLNRLFSNKLFASDAKIFVIDIDAQNIYGKLNSSVQIKVGDIKNVCRETPVIDPLTNEILDTKNSIIAEVKVTKVSEKLIVAKIIKLFDKSNRVKTGDQIVNK
jgi:hypothetical protein